MARANRRRTLTQRGYDELRPEGAPSARTVMRWAQTTWAEVCDAAGVSPGGRRPEWSDDDRLAALRAAAADIGEPLAQADYTRWRRRQPERHAWPSVDLFGSGASWQAWCDRAGVEAGWYEIGRPQRYPDSALLEALRDAGAGSGRVTKAAYNRYRADHPDAPSRATIISRYKRWEDAEAEAAAAGRVPNRRRRRAS